MMRRFFVILCLTFLTCAFPVKAQEQNDGTLHVLRPLIHVEQEDAELQAGLAILEQGRMKLDK